MVQRSEVVGEVEEERQVGQLHELIAAEVQAQFSEEALRDGIRSGDEEFDELQCQLLSLRQERSALRFVDLRDLLLRQALLPSLGIAGPRSLFAVLDMGGADPHHVLQRSIQGALLEEGLAHLVVCGENARHTLPGSGHIGGGQMAGHGGTSGQECRHATAVQERGQMGRRAVSYR